MPGDLRCAISALELCEVAVAESHADDRVLGGAPPSRAKNPWPSSSLPPAAVNAETICPSVRRSVCQLSAGGSSTLASAPAARTPDEPAGVPRSPTTCRRTRTAPG
jgi:hypothetical protein